MLDYNDTGRGNIIVFLHGFCEDKSIWAYYEKELSPYHRVISIDLPGFGHSLEYEAKASMRYYARQIHELIKQLTHNPITLVGHSLGGYIALAYHELFPKFTKSICLINSTSLGDTNEKIKSRNKVIQFIENRGVSLFLQSFVRPLFAINNQETLKENIEKLISSGKRINADAMTSCVKAMRDRKNRFHLLQNISIPVFFIIGKEDQIIPFEHYKDQITASSNIKSVVFEDCGHMAMFEKPTETLHHLKNFVSLC